MRSALCLGNGTEVVARRSDRSAESAEGIVGGTSFAEGLNDGRMLGHGDLEAAMRPNIQVTGFCSDEKGEARTRRSKGPKPSRWAPLSDSPARRERPLCSIHRTAVYETRTYGGVGGEEP